MVEKTILRRQEHTLVRKPELVFSLDEARGRDDNANLKDRRTLSSFPLDCQCDSQLTKHTNAWSLDENSRNEPAQSHALVSIVSRIMIWTAARES
jgi:hypothetical protein